MRVRGVGVIGGFSGLVAGGVLAAASFAGAYHPGVTGLKAKTDRCAARGSRTDAPQNESWLPRSWRANRRVRVYLTGPPLQEMSKYYACSRINGRRTYLFTLQQTDGSVAVTEAIAGDFASYAWFNAPGCKAECPPGVTGSGGAEVVNARTGAKRRLPKPTRPILVTPTGSIAWLEKTPTDAQVWIWDRQGERLVGSGSLGLNKLQIRNHQLLWNDRGQQRSVPIR